MMLIFSDNYARISLRYAIILVGFLYALNVNAASYTVTNAANAGIGTLRAAIDSANSNPGPDVINFAITPLGPAYTIFLTSDLSPVWEEVIIDGYTQSGSIPAVGNNPATMKIELQGDGSVFNCFVLELGSENSVIKGLTINNFTDAAIGILADNIKIEGNHIGTDLTGTSAIGNLIGIAVYDASNAIIGGTFSGNRNVISGNIESGIMISGTGCTMNVIHGNYIGCDASGNAPVANGRGVVIDFGADSTLVGGNNPGEGNVISGNDTDGVVIIDNGTINNLVIGNNIGTDYTGTNPLPNAMSGIYIYDASNNLIGINLPGGRNIISANGEAGIVMEGFSTVNNVVINNYIGTDSSGTLPLGNGNGIIIAYGASGNIIGGVGGGNLISGNINHGIAITDPGTSGNMVESNFIGTDIYGTGAVSNGAFGVSISNAADNNQIGTDLFASPNLISGNFVGVHIADTFAQANRVYGNLIGTDITGTFPLPNLFGVVVASTAHSNEIGGGTPSTRNIISGNDSIGVAIMNSSLNIIKGNYIGVDINGGPGPGNGYSGVSLSNFSLFNVIGGANPGEGNIISGNGSDGVILRDLLTSGNAVLGNIIGTDAGVSQPIPNGGHGVRIDPFAGINFVGGSQPGQGNVISGNDSSGVGIYSGGHSILGNYIGTDKTGTAIMGNGRSGINIVGFALFNNIIGDTSGHGNIIAHNALNGISVDANAGNRFWGNLIFDNGLLGIDLNMDGVTPNDSVDADQGANGLQNFPVIIDALASLQGTEVGIRGRYHSEPGKSYLIEFFGNAILNPTLYGEGETYIGNIEVTTDTNGNATFGQSFPVPVPVGAFVTATATDLDGFKNNTSEFCKGKMVILPNPPDAYSDAFYCEGDLLDYIYAVGDSGAVIKWYSDPGLNNLIAIADSILPFAITGTTVYYATQTLIAIESLADSVFITINPLPSADFAAWGDMLLCEGDCAAIPLITSGVAPYDIVYTDGFTVDTMYGVWDTFFVCPPMTTTYILVWVIDADGCIDIANGIVNVSVLPLPESPEAGEDTSYCQGDSLAPLWAMPENDFNTISWYGDPFLTNLLTVSDTFAPGTVILPGVNFFYVTATDSNGCESPVEIVEVIMNECDDLIIYSGFSPNGDRLNDTWVIDGIQFFDSNWVLIYNRWGNRVNYFKNYDNRENVWNGYSDDGNWLPDGTYFYIIKLPEKAQYKGWVQITR